MACVVATYSNSEQSPERISFESSVESIPLNILESRLARIPVELGSTIKRPRYFLFMQNILLSSASQAFSLFFFSLKVTSETKNHGIQGDFLRQEW